MKFIKDRIDMKVFLLSLAVGLLICYLTVPTPDIIFRHPNPKNLNTIYNDNDTCYRYTGEEVICSINSKETPVNSKKNQNNQEIITV